MHGRSERHRLQPEDRFQFFSSCKSSCIPFLLVQFIDLFIANFLLTIIKSYMYIKFQAEPEFFYLKKIIYICFKASEKME